MKIISSFGSHLRTAIALLGFAVLSACAAGQSPVIETFDEQTAVTYTYSRTPLILSPETPLDATNTREYLQIGAIEVNRMGYLTYYLWLGISDTEHLTESVARHEGFQSVLLVVGDQELPLDILGWEEETIGVSEPVYKKLFSTSVDAYYEVTLKQIELLAGSDRVKLYTTGPAPQEFVSWYSQSTANEDLAAFLESVRL